MKAWILDAPAPAATKPMRLAETEDPRPGPDDVLIAVRACGVCRTDLHIVEGELAAPRLPVTPGHQAVGRVLEAGERVRRFRPGDRVGVAWVHRFCGECEHCIEGRENLCLAPTFTGFHVPGGFAERIVAPAAFVHRIPDDLGDDVHAAPLLCAGIIGFRAVKRSGLAPGERLALYGFGAAGHITLQIAKAWGCEVFVVTRGREAADRALKMGASWAGLPGEPLPRPPDRAITFAPAGSVLPDALAALRRGGTLAVAGIYLDRIPEMDYDRHLFQEKQLLSVTANTRADARELLDLAGRLGLRTDVEVFPFAEAGEALARLKEDRLQAQAAVLRIA